jgi:RNA polymerase sigma-70 factor (ECF subfamily)
MTDREDRRKSFMEGLAGHQGIIHKVGHLYFDDAVEREDFFQEVLLNAWGSYASFAGGSAFTTWLYRVALNTALQRLRADCVKRRRFVAAPAEEATQVAAAPAVGEAVSRDLRRAIEGLDDLEKSIILLYIEGSTYVEIADITGLTEGHVGVKINRIKNKLRERLAPREDRHGT